MTETYPDRTVCIVVWVKHTLLLSETFEGEFVVIIIVVLICLIVSNNWNILQDK